VQVLPTQGRTDRPNDLHIYGLNFTADDRALDTLPAQTPLSVRFVSNSKAVAAVRSVSRRELLLDPAEILFSDPAFFPQFVCAVAPALNDLWSNSLAVSGPVTCAKANRPNWVDRPRDGGSGPLANVTVNFL